MANDLTTKVKALAVRVVYRDGKPVDYVRRDEVLAVLAFAPQHVIETARRTLDQGLCFDKTARITRATDAEILRFAAELTKAPNA